MAVPYTFGSATSAIPLSQLDSNFATAITLGNTAIQLGNTVTTLNNMTLANVTVSSGNVTVTTLTAPTINSGSSVALSLQSNGTTGIYMDTSQNVGIGTSSPSVKLDVYGTSQTTIARTYAGSTSFTQYIDDSVGGVYLAANTASGTNAKFLAFQTVPSGGAATERMRIDSSGNLLVGTTSALSVGATSGSGFETQGSGLIIQNIANAGACRYVTKTSGGTTNTYFDSFYVGATNVGYIISPTGTTVLYSSVSDYRLKENVQPMTGALNLVSQLKPCSYTWKSDGSSSDGFIAHELQEVFPQAVSGVKDAVDENGKPVYQGIDTSMLVATLTAAIQEQQSQITDLQAKLKSAGVAGF